MRAIAALLLVAVLVHVAVASSTPPRTPPPLRHATADPGGPPPPAAPPADWAAEVAAGRMFWSPTLPEADRAPLIGNGFLAMNVMGDSLYAGGVFNGNLTQHTTSHRARLPPYQWQIGSAAPGAVSLGWALALDTAVWMTRWTTANGSFVEERWYAHQLMRNVLVYEVHFATPNTTADSLQLTGAQVGGTSTDVNLTQVTSPPQGTIAFSGPTLVPETASSGVVEVAMVATMAPPQALQVPAGRHIDITFVLAVSHSLDNATDPMGTAVSAYNNAMAASGAAIGLLRGLHSKQWAAINEAGRIEIEGDLELAQAVNSSLYSIISSARSDWAYGLSPGSLANDGYNGHSFWDMETWMEPPILYLHDDIAQSLLQYRVDRIKPAAAKAAAHGAKGLWFPWESAFSGDEQCPCGGPSADPGWGGGAEYEQHVNGDIALAALQYWWATGDSAWLKSSGYPLISGVAEFWASRAVRCTAHGNASRANQMCINDVMGPDEYHGGVNNSAYTNAIAALTLQGASDASRTLGSTPPAEWEAIAHSLYIPFDTDKRYHPEYDGYTTDVVVKQADTVMMQYPLNVSMPRDVALNDLLVYLNSTDSNGPAMTYAIYAIAALDAGNASQAASLFTRGYANVRGDFQVWTETPHGGCTPFITGAGGFLQSVLQGYVGTRLASSPGGASAAPGVLTVNPRAPPSPASAITAHGVGFLGTELRVRTNATHAKVTVLSNGSTQGDPMRFVGGEGGQPAGLTLHVPSTGDGFALNAPGDIAEWAHAPAVISMDA